METLIWEDKEEDENRNLVKDLRKNVEHWIVKEEKNEQEKERHNQVTENAFAFSFFFL